MRIWNRACDVHAALGLVERVEGMLESAVLQHSVEHDRVPEGDVAHMRDEEEMERLEDAYYEHGGDANLDAAFQRLLAKHPEQFAPVD
jgi:hypothetical protein